jgi:hypothetical protein
MCTVHLCFFLGCCSMSSCEVCVLNVRMYGDLRTVWVLRRVRGVSLFVYVGYCSVPSWLLPPLCFSEGVPALGFRAGPLVREGCLPAL